MPDSVPDLDRLMILSIRPRYVESILNGTKSVELRRTRPNVEVGQPIAIYSTSPVASIVAVARVAEVSIGSPTAVWDSARDSAAVTREEFRHYFFGCSTAVAIHLDQVEVLEDTVTLGHMRKQMAFQPPQTWHFVDERRLARLLGAHPSATKLRRLLEASST